MNINKRKTSLITQVAQFCSVCLSSDRKLVRSVELSNLFWKYFNDIKMLVRELDLCWECRNMLSKIEVFRNKAELAQQLMKITVQFGSMTTPIKSLSKLTTVTIQMENAVIPKEEIEEKPTIQDDCDDKDKLEIKVEEDISKELYNSLSNEYIAPHLDNLSDTDYKDSNKLENDSDSSLSLEVTTKIENEENKILLNTKYDGNDINKPKVVEKSYENEKNTTVKKKKVYLKRYNTENCVFPYSKKKSYYIKTVSIHKKDLGKALDMERQKPAYKNREFKCTYENCLSAFVNKFQLLGHQNIHKERKKTFNCDICSIKLTSRNRLRAHTANHYRMYRCTICNFTSYAVLGKGEINEHVNIHRNTAKCMDCSTHLPNKKSYLEHKRRCNNIFQCDYCGATRQSKKQIKRHILYQHSDYPCHICSYPCKNRRNYVAHLARLHVVDAGENTYCVLCDKQFSNSVTYKQHVYYSLAHAHEKNGKTKTTHPCPDCGKVYASRKTMENHQKCVHKNQAPYTCEHCGKKFTQCNPYREHKLYHHEGVPRKKDKLCTVCGRGFHTRRILDNHMRTHTGERPFQCEFCPSAFAQKQSLKMHTKKLHCKNLGNK